MLASLPQRDRERLIGAMAVIERLLGAAPPAAAVLRDPRPGDIGWVVQSHGSLYASEYGFDSKFESLVGEITAKFLTSFDAARERCWIADIDGNPVGSVFLVRHTDDIAKLRLLLVDPAARGQRLGQRLVAECIAFAQACGYRKITLWTQSVLVAARSIYQNAGFVLVASEPHRNFGRNLIGETWEREV
jgi:GNAT superfamily N-acetyltransferase